MSIAGTLRTLIRRMSAAILIIVMAAVAAGGLVLWLVNGVTKTEAPSQQAAARLEVSLQQVAAGISAMSVAASSVDLEAADSATNAAIAKAHASETDLSIAQGRKTTDTSALDTTRQHLLKAVLERIVAGAAAATAMHGLNAVMEQVTSKVNSLGTGSNLRRAEAQQALEEARTSATTANTELRRLSSIREELREVRALIDRPAGIDSKHRLRPLEERMATTLTRARSLLSDSNEHDRILLADLAAVEFGYAGADTGLLALRRAQLADPANDAARSAMSTRSSELAAPIDRWLERIIEAADPLEVTTRKAAEAMEAKVAAISDCTSLELAARDCVLFARALATEANLFPGRAATPEDAKVFRTVVTSRLRDLRLKLGSTVGMCDRLAAIEEAALARAAYTAVDAVEPLILGPAGIAVAVERRLDATSRATATATTAIPAVNSICTLASAAAAEAHENQGSAMGHISLALRIGVPTLLVLGLFSLFAAHRMGNRVASGILVTEAHERERTERLSCLLGDVATSSHTVSTASAGLVHASASLAASASTSRDVSAQVGEGAIRANDAVSSVAAAAEEMQATMGEISRQTSRAAEVARAAVGHTTSTDAAVKRLADASREIGEIVQVIAGIAEQTNLLALNATIEAARAGDAGRGFAVVASEVKALARQSGTASQDIAGKIKAIQQEVAAAGGALGQIRSVVSEIDGIQTSIAAAVEEQTATSREMSSSLASAAATCREIAERIRAVVVAVGTTSEQAATVQQLADQLAATARELDSQVVKG